MLGFTPSAPGRCGGGDWRRPAECCWSQASRHGRSTGRGASRRRISRRCSRRRLNPAHPPRNRGRAHRPRRSMLPFRRRLPQRPPRRPPRSQPRSHASRAARTGLAWIPSPPGSRGSKAGRRARRTSGSRRSRSRSARRPRPTRRTVPRPPAQGPEWRRARRAPRRLPRRLRPPALRPNPASPRLRRRGLHLPSRRRHHLRWACDRNRYVASARGTACSISCCCTIARCTRMASSADFGLRSHTAAAMRGGVREHALLVAALTPEMLATAPGAGRTAPARRSCARRRAAVQPPWRRRDAGPC